VLDGYETTRRASSHPGALVPIIALTANAMDEERQRCIDAGMDLFLAKPVTRESLQRAIAAALEISRGEPGASA
jgi:CheY-like chemotaxis protein